MNRDKSIAGIAASLQPYLPKGTSDLIAAWIVDDGVRFTVSRPRLSKLGDFRAGTRSMPAAISVNGDLNPYGFLITTVHEFAHLACHAQYGRRVKPHGREWKRIYTEMLAPFIEKNIFPEEIEKALRAHVASPSASSCSCPVLNRALALYDDKDTLFLGDLSVGSTFLFRDEAFKSLEKKRTRYLCERLDDGRRYLISGRAQVDSADR